MNTQTHNIFELNKIEKSRDNINNNKEQATETERLTSRLNANACFRVVLCA